MSPDSNDAEPEEQGIKKTEKFPSHLIDSQEVFSFSYENILEIGKNFRSSDYIVMVIDDLLNEENIDISTEDKFILDSLLQDEIQVIKFSIDTRNNILSL